METSIEARELQPVLYALKQASDEGFLIFKEDCMEAVVTDPAMVLMEEARIDSENFEEYNPELDSHEDLQYEDREGIHVGINYGLLHSLVNHQSTTDNIEFSLEEDSAELVIDVGSNSFQLPILNLGTEDIPDTGSLEFNVETDLKITHFKNALDNLKLFGDSTTFTVTEDEEVELFTEGNVGQTTQNVTVYEFEDLREDSDEEGEVLAESMYALNYLSDIRKACGKLLSNREKVTFSLGNDFPLKVECEKSGRYVKFVLAPRIEEE